MYISVRVQQRRRRGGKLRTGGVQGSCCMYRIENFEFWSGLGENDSQVNSKISLYQLNALRCYASFDDGV